LNDESFEAKLAFADLTVDDRIELLDNLLTQLSADQVHVAVNDPECLGLVAEARLIGLTRSDELARCAECSYTAESDLGLRRRPQR
jgi:hypothetical protein